jgi:pimeloyl-ACP methyl ester carboxylesterase
VPTSGGIRRRVDCRPNADRFCPHSSLASCYLDTPDHEKGLRTMTTFVLVPGAWLGGWAWRPVARRLRAGGHDVYALSLTGLGERRHLSGPEVDLDTHVADVVNLIDMEDLRDVVLVGHSYAGAVVTGVADRVAERLSQLVYIDSGPIGDGQCYLDLSAPDARALTERLIAERGDGWRWPVPTWDELEAGGASLDGLGDEQRALFRAKAVPQPAGTITQPIRLTNPARKALPTLGVLCSFPEAQVRELIAAGHPWFAELAGPQWRLAELPTGHWPLLSAPDPLARLLLDESTPP